MGDKMSDELKRAFSIARDNALQSKDSILRVEHVIYGILISDNSIHEIFKDKVKDFNLLLDDISNLNKKLSNKDNTVNTSTILKFDSYLQDVLNLCVKKKKNNSIISVELFFILVFDLDISLIKLIKNYGVTKTYTQKKLRELNKTLMHYSEDGYEKKGGTQNENQTNKSKSKTPIIDGFSRDLTALANEGKIDPVIGRDDEVNRVAQVLARRKKNNPILIGDPGVGKCLAKGTKVLMYDGSFKKVEDIVINDQLMGVDSTPRNVLSLGCGRSEMFEVTQTKGMSYIVNDAHILSLKTSTKGNNDKVININIMDFLELPKNKQNDYKGWKTGVEFNEIYVPKDPYFVGLWLAGDGKKDDNSSKDVDLTISKRIPDTYLRNSRMNRLKLLAGFLDGNSILYRNTFKITQKNKDLVDDIVYLVNSLGYRIQVKEEINKNTIYYHMSITGNNLNEIPCTTPNKKIINKKSKTDKQLTNISVKSVGVGEYYGFNIDGDHLFLLEDFTVTHNTAIAEGLAIKIATNECPRPLLNKRLVTLDLTSLVAGTKYRGQFEERIKALIDEVKENPDIILFIDEIHTLVGAGNSSGSLDAANVFKPALARGEIQCIGATTLNEYREHIEKDGALDRRFQKVMVTPPTLEQTKQILLNIKNTYEGFHKVIYTDEAIDEIIRLSDRYITNREFPDKAIDILDEAGSRAQVKIKPPQKIKSLESKLNDIKKQKLEVVKTQKFELAADLREMEKETLSELEKENRLWSNNINTFRTTIDEQTICEVVSNMTGIPVSKVSEKEVEKLLIIDKEIEDCVVGQNDAIKKITSAIKRNRTGIRKQNKPIGSFLFIGPTGVGKTELAKVLADKVFGTEDAIIRVDMSEYGEKFNVSKLIGAPPGYVGYNEGGQLTEKVKNKPYSLILFDEIEKAHPDIFNVLLQLLDEGFLTDGSGRKINFKNTIIIMTSNIGMDEVQNFGNKIGFSTDSDNTKSIKDIVDKSLRKFFKPEFLNRLDELVFFNHLNQEDILKIVDIQLKGLDSRLAESNYTIKITKQAKEKLAVLGYDKTYGVRELNRTIQKYIEDPMSEELLKRGMPKEGVFKVTYNLKQDKIIVTLI